MEFQWLHKYISDNRNEILNIHTNVHTIESEVCQLLKSYTGEDFYSGFGLWRSPEDLWKVSATPETE